jgi:kumamolisin
MISFLLRRVASRGSFLAVMVWGVALGVATPTPSTAQDPTAQDLGPTAASQTVTASIILKVPNTALLEAYVSSTQQPFLPTYHRFLSLPTFVRYFAPSSASIALLTRYLSGYGIQVTSILADHLVLEATGTVDAFNKAFALNVHDFMLNGRRFHRPRSAPQVPFFLRDVLVAVVGPSDAAQFHSMHMRVSDRVTAFKHPAQPMLPAHGATATGVPGEYTVGDVANFYDINPLYQAHINGRGQTLGISTLSNFYPADAYTYWSLVGLSVLPNRITQVHLDGGGAIDSGSLETSLDVEQSGGLASQAKIIVYDAPNTDEGFIDTFYQAASDNLVDSLSTSWGEAEEYYFAGLNDGVDYTPELLAYHQAFLELAAQGISTFASAGDSGAYDINDAYNDPVNNVLSVDYPAADPALTAAGGTTLPFTFTLLNPPPNTPPLVVPTQQVWGWDYLQNYLVEYLGPQYQNYLFPVGGGGGVSIFWQRPFYQIFTPGVRNSEPGQSVVYAGTDLLDLPASFPGRNVPDVSLNADPESGYILYSTADGGLLDGYGGTSFVAPQLNGISALLSQSTGGSRLGLWNPMLYQFKRFYSYSTFSPLVDITAGDNWFYFGIPGYEPGAGLGVLDVAKLAAAISRN